MSFSNSTTHGGAVTRFKPRISGNNVSSWKRRYFLNPFGVFDAVRR
jgi:hypothetical protein